MGVELLNIDQMRNEISKAIADYRIVEYQSTDASNMPQDRLIALIDSLLFEREQLLIELDELKEAVENPVQSTMYVKDSNFKILLSEVEESLYNDFLCLSHRLGLPPGKILTFLMDFVLKTSDDESIPKLSSSSFVQLFGKSKPEIKIRDQEFLTVTGAELHAMDGKVSFYNIDTLQFTEIDTETFSTSINKIRNCGIVRVPVSLLKLLVYAKCHQVDLFEFYEDENSEADPIPHENTVEV